MSDSFMQLRALLRGTEHSFLCVGSHLQTFLRKWRAIRKSPTRSEATAKFALPIQNLAQHLRRALCSLRWVAQRRAGSFYLPTFSVRVLQHRGRKSVFDRSECVGTRWTDFWIENDMKGLNSFWKSCARSILVETGYCHLKL